MAKLRKIKKVPAGKKASGKLQTKPDKASEVEAQARALRKFLFPHATD